MTQIEEIKGKITPMLRSAGVRKAALFGSVARGEAGPESDIDILVDMPHNISLLDVIGLKLDLEELLGKKVDLVQYDAIKPLIRPYIMKDELVIF